MSGGDVVTKGVAGIKTLLAAVRQHPGCGQTVRVARFLLGLYNGSNHPFDLTDLRSLDEPLFRACMDALELDRLQLKECHQLFSNGPVIWMQMQADYAKSANLRKLSQARLLEMGK